MFAILLSSRLCVRFLFITSIKNLKSLELLFPEGLRVGVTCGEGMRVRPDRGLLHSDGPLHTAAAFSVDSYRFDDQCRRIVVEVSHNDHLRYDLLHK